MAYSKDDLQALADALFAPHGLWAMMSKDLRQMADLPSHFETHSLPHLGTGINLSLVIVTMSCLEAIATFANIGDSIRGRQDKFATDVVVAFGERYYPDTNPQYRRPSGESLIRLIWDAYRNGGLHRFLPKHHDLTDSAGHSVTITFAVGWAEAKDRAKRSCPLSEVEAWRAVDRSLSTLRPPHLGLERVDGGMRFTVCPQALVLELFSAVEAWQRDLQTNAEAQDWFLVGANAFDRTRKLKGGPGRACLESLAAALP